MINNKQKNFISVVIYVYNNQNQIFETLTNINNVLNQNFEKYEIICVNDASTDNSTKEIEKFSKTLSKEVLRVINMSYYQGLELSMNAGVDLAIGDFVYEFDSIIQDYDNNLIMDVYKKCLEGYDIVGVTSKKNHKKASSIFYMIFNKYSEMQYKIHTETFRILSRRAINRVYSIRKNVPYRKAVYACCGLNMFNIIYNSPKNNKKSFDKKTKNNRKETGINSLILFTNIGFKFSISMSLIMALFTILVAIYTIIIFINNEPVQGWTTTMLFLSFAFCGLFIILTIIIKYLEIIIELIFKKKNYTIESIEKLN